jgi:hypothetical protein
MSSPRERQLRRCFISVRSGPEAVADKKGGGVRGGFLVMVGFISLGIGASMYYGELGFGSLTKGSSAVQQSGSPWAYLPIGLGVLLMISGLVLAILDRRAA